MALFSLHYQPGLPVHSHLEIAPAVHPYQEVEAQNRHTQKVVEEVQTQEEASQAEETVLEEVLALKVNSSLIPGT